MWYISFHKRIHHFPLGPAHPNISTKRNYHPKVILLTEHTRYSTLFRFFKSWLKNLDLQIFAEKCQKTSITFKTCVKSSKKNQIILKFVRLESDKKSRIYHPRSFIIFYLDTIHIDNDN